VRDQGIIFDPDAHVSGDAEEGADVREVLALRPVVDFGNFGVIRDAAFVGALVSEDGDFRLGNGKLLGGNGGAGAEKAVEDAMDIVDVNPDKVADLRVSRDSLIPSVLGFEVGLRTLDIHVIQEGNSGVQNFGL